RQTPTTPAVHAGTDVRQVPSPQVKVPRSSSVEPSQSSSWLLHDSPAGRTWPVHGPQMPKSQRVVPATQAPTPIIADGPSKQRREAFPSTLSSVSSQSSPAQPTPIP